MIKLHHTKQWILLLAMALLPFLLRAQDVGVSAIISPTDGNCPSTSQSISVIIFNAGSTSVSNIPVKVSVTGAKTFSDNTVYTKTLAVKGSDTVNFTGFKTTGGGKITIKAYTALSGDKYAGDDTTTNTLVIAAVKPNEIKLNDSVLCGTGYSTIYVPHQNGVITAYFSDMTSNELLDTGSKKSEIISQSKNYYVQNFSLVNDSVNISEHNGYYNYTTDYYGYIFDMHVKVTTLLNGINFYLTGNDSFEIYYKEGSSNGYERTSSSWTKLYQGYHKPSSGSVPIHITLPTTLLKGGHTYGFYFWAPKSHLYFIDDYPTEYQDSGVSRSLTIPHGLWVTGGVKFGAYGTTDYTLPGKFFYKTFSTCSSTRKKIYHRVKVGTTGAGYAMGSPFKGLYNLGTSRNPDQVCPRDTATYEFLPPTAYTNADYGTKWKITAKKVVTSGGNVLKDTLTTQPSGTNNFSIRIIPPAGLQDSTILVMITVTSFDTCENTYIRQLRVGDLPVAYFTTTPICEGLQTTFKDSSFIKGGGYLGRFWDFGDGGSGSRTYETHTYQKAGNYTVSLTVQSASKCTDTKTKVVTVNAKPVVDFTSTPLCAGVDVTFSDATKTAGKITSYYWKFPDGTTSTSATPTYSRFTKAGTYTITYGVIINTGCSDTITKDIVISALPQPHIKYEAACVGLPAHFSDTTKADVGMTYFWDFGDGVTSTLPNPTHAYSIQNPFDVTLSVTSGSSNCVGKDAIKASPFPFPKARFVNDAGCAGSPVQFNDSSNYAGAGQAAIRWNFGDGSGVSGKGTPTHTYAKAGSYKVSLYVQNTNGCADSTTQTISISPEPTADFIGQNVCVQKSVHFVNKSTGTGTLTYFWDFGDAAGTSTDKNPVYTYSQPGTYNVTLKLMQGGCVTTATKPVIISPLPTATWKIVDRNQDGQTITVKADNTTYKSYKWEFDRTVSSDTTHFSQTHKFRFSNSQYNICLTVTDNNGCTNSDCEDIKVFTGIHEAMQAQYHINIFPNPFTGNTNLQYSLHSRSMTKILLMDVNGRILSVVKSAGMEQPGEHSLEVNAKDLSAGIYVLRIIVGNDCYNERIEKLK